MHFAQWRQFRCDAKKTKKRLTRQVSSASQEQTARVRPHNLLVAITGEKVALPLSKMPLNNCLTRLLHESLEKEDVMKCR